MAYLTIAEAGKKLRVSRWTIARLIKSGELHAIKGDGRNGRVKIAQTSVQEYERRHAIAPAEAAGA
jgi:excisionase family DNA binding protein